MKKKRPEMKKSSRKESARKCGVKVMCRFVDLGNYELVARMAPMPKKNDVVERSVRDSPSDNDIVNVLFFA